MIKRTLCYTENGEDKSVSQFDLFNFSSPLVILGDAGMGKSLLLEWMADERGVSFCTARQLINSVDPCKLLDGSPTIIIDGLDEVGYQNEGGAVSEVLRKLGLLEYPHFVLSCRACDWYSATGALAIQEQYINPPLELHLKPLNDEEAICYLGDILGVDAANTTIAHYNDRGLEGMLGNPQTLEMIAEVAKIGALSNSRSELFELTTNLLRQEHKELKAYRELEATEALDASGAAFACMILHGSEAITRKVTSKLSSGELQISQMGLIPGGENIERVIDSRLFRSRGTDRFGYYHRRIGEYLGARWLAKYANSKHKRRRLLSLFHSNGLVPANLRGIHAWLALDQNFTAEIILADPLGVIEYGDADNLTLTNARTLLDSLIKLVSLEPNFNDRTSYSCRGLIHPGLVDEIKELILDADTPFSLVILLLESIVLSGSITKFVSELRSIVLSDSSSYSVRYVALKGLVKLESEEWTEFTRILCINGSHSSIRLAIDLMDLVGYLAFDDGRIVNIVISYACIKEPVIGPLWRIRKNLPIKRIEGVLDLFCEQVIELEESIRRIGSNELTDFAYHLIVRHLEYTSITTPHKLWHWLSPFSCDIGYDSASREKLYSLLCSNTSLRRGVQRLVLLELPLSKNIFHRLRLLLERSNAFAVSENDAISLLESLEAFNQSDERWRGVVQLIEHDELCGKDLRSAAAKFIAHRPDLQVWVEKLAESRKPDWQVKQEKRKRGKRAKKAMRLAENRTYFEANIDLIRSGDSDALIELARAYLNLLWDLDKGEPPHKRIESWVGEFVNEAAKTGFENFLHKDPKPTVEQISKSLAEGKYWPKANIIVAALAERVRKRVGFQDLPDERLLAGFIECRRSKIEIHAEVGDLENSIREELLKRHILKDAFKLYYEPQLEARLADIHDLCDLMGDVGLSEIATELSLEWLRKYTNLPAKIEMEFADHLIKLRKYQFLNDLLEERIIQIDDERMLAWSSVNIITNFQKASKRIGRSPIQPELLWYIHDRLGGVCSNNKFKPELKAEQLSWIISNFRELWPYHAAPWERDGCRNSWDASELIIQLIHKLGKDTGDAATAALECLIKELTDGYTHIIKSVAREQARIRLETRYYPPTIEAVNAIIRGEKPCCIEDLQKFMINELEIAQAKIKSDDVESWRGFFNDRGEPFNEERCRDHLLGLLRQGSEGITLQPEAHVGEDKEVDITCSVGKLRLPIEVKGQWHNDLWLAADSQLDRYYGNDWRAEGRGIYLVLWFGQEPANIKKHVKSPGRRKNTPTSALELCNMLKEESQAAKEERVMVFVLDLTNCKNKDASYVCGSTKTKTGNPCQIKVSVSNTLCKRHRDSLS